MEGSLAARHRLLNMLSFCTLLLLNLFQTQHHRCKLCLDVRLFSCLSLDFLLLQSLLPGQDGISALQQLLLLSYKALCSRRDCQ